MDTTKLSKREEVALRLMAAMIGHYGIPDDDVKANTRDCVQDAFGMAEEFLRVIA